MQYINFGQFIRNKRLAISPKISLNQFAIENDIDPATLSRIENEKQGISINLLAKIAHGFNLNGSSLLKEYENNYNN